MRNKWLYLLLLIFIVIFLLMPRQGHPGDTVYWSEWATHIRDYGLLNAYDNATINYLPPFLYVLDILQRVIQDISITGPLMYAVKAVTLLFDAGIIIIFWQICKKYQTPFRWLLLVLLNAAFFYTTIIWGQIDSIPIFFLITAFWSAINKRRYLSITLYVIAVTIKLQGIILAPIIALLLLTDIWQNKQKLWEIIKALFFALSIEIILVSPFIIAGKLGSMFNVVGTSVGFYNEISYNAYNLWLLIKGPGGIYASDNTAFIGSASYHQVGLSLFVMALILVTTPALLVSYRMLKQKRFDWQQRQYISFLSLTAALIVTVFFFFNTQMHERYLLPALAFYAVNALLSRKPLILILMSLGAFINLENVMGAFALLHKIEIFGSRPSALLILLGMVLAIISLYRQFKKIYHKTPA